MATKSKKFCIFFAIPCGEFYAIQAKIIATVCNASGVEAVIAEDDMSTKPLWDSIVRDIDRSHAFAADITSSSPNILLELGYAIRQKGPSNCAIFTANSTGEPSDLRGFVAQRYASFTEFQSRLRDWLLSTVPNLDSLPAIPMEPQETLFVEDFRDKDIFVRRWAAPIGASYLFTHEGLRIGFSYLPVMSTCLSLLRDCRIEWHARIDHRQIGICFFGTRPLGQLSPTIAVLLTLTTEGRLMPHIMNWNSQSPHFPYTRFDDREVETLFRPGAGTWFTIITRLQGHEVQILHDDIIQFRMNLEEEPYRAALPETLVLSGEIGMRCHAEEQATINRIVITPLSAT